MNSSTAKRVIALLLVAGLIGAAACTPRAEATATPTEPARPTRSVPVQPPVSPFDLIATVFPPTPTPTALPRPVPTVIERAGGLPIGPNPTPSDLFRLFPTQFAMPNITVIPFPQRPEIFRSTPTPFVVQEDQVLVQAFTMFGTQPRVTEDSLWFEDRQFIIRTDLSGQRISTFETARAGPISFAVTEDQIFVLDIGQGLLHSYSSEGSQIWTTPSSFGSELKFAQGDLWVYSNITRQMTRFSMDGAQISSFVLQGTPGTFDVSEDAIWFWRNAELARFSLDGDLEAVFDVPSIPERERLAEAIIEYDGGYIWLSGRTNHEVVRVNEETGELLEISLTLDVDEFNVESTVGVLVLDDSVWTIREVWPLSPRTPGASQSQFRRIEVFDHEGNSLRTADILAPVFDVSLTHVPSFGEVWAVRSTATESTLLQRYEIDDFVE